MRKENLQPLIIEGQHTLELSATIIDSRLCVTYGEHVLHNFNSQLIDRVAGGGDVDVVLRPFAHEGKDYHVYAVTVAPGGQFSPWTSDSDGTLRQSIAADSQLRFALVAADDSGLEIHSDDYPVIVTEPMPTPTTTN